MTDPCPFLAGAGSVRRPQDARTARRSYGGRGREKRSGAVLGEERGQSRGKRSGAILHTPLVIPYSQDVPRPRRASEGGLIDHALNRANARLAIFQTDQEYAAFQRVLAEAVVRRHMRLLAYCLMPDHFHVLLWPREDGDLSRFMSWLTMTHTQLWHVHHRTAGTGHLHQGLFKSFPVQSDERFLTVCRYVERNALRANSGRVTSKRNPLKANSRFLGDHEQSTRIYSTPKDAPTEFDMQED
jgi:REP element-mobilizing transposase RayT